MSAAAVISLPPVAALPEAVRVSLKKLSVHDWTAEDWRDLINMQRIVAHNVAVRHGLTQGAEE